MNGRQSGGGDAIIYGGWQRLAKGNWKCFALPSSGSSMPMPFTNVRLQLTPEQLCYTDLFSTCLPPELFDWWHYCTSNWCNTYFDLVLCEKWLKVEERQSYLLECEAKGARFGAKRLFQCHMRKSLNNTD
ncbi:hypothetical protein TYRP_020162 [Tyrophagus putrescentiae]|nr:hypothetical protein TYRP_020162 [Tyrophagus putrescentiae]